MASAITVWVEEPRIENDGGLCVAYSDQLKPVGCGNTEEVDARELEVAMKTGLKAFAVDGGLFETLGELKTAYEKAGAPPRS
ncbi:MAG: hypothetical protein V3S10_02860 [Dehalococcoidales bacterium]